MHNDIYRYDGNHYPLTRDTGPAPECRLEISPPTPAREHFFLHVLTATEVAVDSVLQATAQVADDHIEVSIAGRMLRFARDEITMHIDVPTAVVENKTRALPQTLILEQNQPNPLNASTVIQFALPLQTHVELTVYNQLGQKVATLIDGTREPGAYAAHWNGRDDMGGRVASGVYQYRLRAGDEIQTRSAVLLH